LFGVLQIIFIFICVALLAISTAIYLQCLLLTPILPKPLISKNKGGKAMKFKLTVLLAAVVVTAGILLGTSTAEAQSEVICEGTVA
jgi:hypothetical protein